DPVDDFHDGNPPSHPELLDRLAEDFVASEFDLDRLYAAICLSDAYQRTIRLTDPLQFDRMYALMSVKALSGDQFFDSLALSVAYVPRAGGSREEDPVRRRVLDLFADQEPSAPPETSVAAALTLMNGQLIAKATDFSQSARLQ